MFYDHVSAHGSMRIDDDEVGLKEKPEYYIQQRSHRSNTQSVSILGTWIPNFAPFVYIYTYLVFILLFLIT